MQDFLLKNKSVKIIRIIIAVLLSVTLLFGQTFVYADNEDDSSGDEYNYESESEEDYSEDNTEESSDEYISEESDYEEDDQSVDYDFESFMDEQGFPESYRVLLRDLHSSHPSWTFYSVQTGIDWYDLVENERNKSGQVKNLVYCSSYEPNYNWRSTEVGYDYDTNTWYPYDGSTWFAASNDFVRYYLDPRTYLYEGYVFCFESLSYQSGMQNQTGVEAILSGSFMGDSYPPGEWQLYSDIIMSAAEESGASPYHLASRMKQEMGNEMGVAASGESNSYPGIYNYFNIGAFDTPSGSAVYNGLSWAATPGGSYGRPWDSPSKSIIGGAEYLASSYIACGQDTLYTQKFNVTNTSCLYYHQYMSNVQAPANEGYSQYRAYAANGLLDSAIVFKIPVYENMPDYPVSKPSESGTPNDYLAYLSIDGYSLTPSFRSDVVDYSLIVDESVSDISISAPAAAGSSNVSGTGTISLYEGTNKLVISVTSDTGSVRNYNLTVVRGKGSSGGGNASVSPGARGDLNGDGKISAIDIVKIQRLIVGLEDLTDDIRGAADVNQDGKVSALDIIKIQRHIVGIETIDQ